MKITILQRNIEWANPQANVARADEAISCLPDSDLFVFTRNVFHWFLYATRRNCGERRQRNTSLDEA